MKKRVFVVNDSSFIASGYGVYGKELLTRLHNSGKYEVAELGCYADCSRPEIKNIPWKFYPNAVPSNDKLFDLYKNNAANQFGAWRFNRAILDFKPHIVFDVRDYWMSSYQETSPYRKHFHWVLMPTVDSAPQRTEWYYTFANADVVIPYTEWAKKTLFDGGGDRLNIFPKIANAGINPNEFYPIENKKEHKMKYFGHDYNIVGLVMRNQKRKLIPDIFIAFKNYLNLIKDDQDQYDKTYLYLHTSYPEENGWDLPSLLLEYGLLDKTYFTYTCRHCGKCFPSKFKNSLIKCQHCNIDNVACFASVANSVSTESLNEIYNLFDVFIQYAICEGFGMPQVEAAACGIQIASVDYSAMTEITENLNGIKIPVKRLFRELETNADRSYPDNDFTTNMLYEFFNQTSPETRAINSKKIREKCLSIYTWDNVYKVWDECFDQLRIEEKIPWNINQKFTTNHENMSVPANLNAREFVEYICSNIINEPYLIRTAGVQQLIKDLSSKIVARHGSIKGFTFQDAVSVLEQHLNNKNVAEEMRQKEASLAKEDYLTCQQ
jgi:glycosyltransferase involved in cell wall biosynthesis